MACQPDSNGGVPERFEYFRLRLTRSGQYPERLAGLVERLGSGEKRSFDSAEELLRLIGSEVASNMQPWTGHRNVAGSDPGQSE
jgi:hypothetical protein